MLFRSRHDWTSHASDAFRYLAVCWREEYKETIEDKPIKGLTVGENEVTLDELWAMQPKQLNKRI